MLTTGFSESILGILSKLSEGTSIHRVVEGFLVLLALASMLSASMILNSYLPLMAFGIASIYGSYHLRRCRNLYQSYLWGVEGSGYRLENRSTYRGVIISIICVEILMIAGGAAAIIAPIASLDMGVVRTIATAITLSFGIIAVVGHLTRVRLYRIFISKVRGSG